MSTHIRTRASSLLLAVAIGALFAGSGCATNAPPELRDARTAYARAATSSPNASFANADLLDARQWLGKAERSYAERGATEATRDLAYVAHRLAIVAEANGDGARAKHERDVALAELQQIEAQRAYAERWLERRTPPMAPEATPGERGARVSPTGREGINPSPPPR